MTIIKTVLAQGIKVKAGTQPIKDISNEFDFGQYGSLGSFASTLIILAFSVAAIMVTFFFIIAAIEMITSQGDKAHLVSARSKIYHSIIGFILLISLYLIMRYLMPALVPGFTILF